MSRRSIGRDIMDAKLQGVQDAGLRMNMLMRSPYKKHRQQALAMGEMVNKMQQKLAEATDPTEA